MEHRRWHEIAEAWDDAQGDTGDLWQRTLIQPGILKVIGTVKDLDVLDVGCGNGSLSRKLARMGNRVTGVDASGAIVERARAREAANPLGIKYYIADAGQIKILADETFDLVVSNIMLMDNADAVGAIEEMARLVRERGRIVMLISHPCFDIPGASSWLLERRFGQEPEVSIRLSRYREVFSAWVQMSDKWAFEVEAHHRPLSWYFRAIRAAGLAVTLFDEPEPTPEFLALPGHLGAIDKFPVHCVIEARRWPVNDAAKTPGSRVL